MSFNSSVTSLNSLSKKRGPAGSGGTYDIVAVKTKSSEIKPYEVSLLESKCTAKSLVSQQQSSAHCCNNSWFVL